MAPKAIDRLSGKTGYSVRYESFHGSDGTLLYGLLLAKPGNKVTVLSFGGDNFETGDFGLKVGLRYESLGVNAFLVDYRGYGMSEGNLSSVDTSQSDALAAYDFLRADAAPRDSAIVVDGLSLGSFMAPYVADHRTVSGLVLQSTATNVSDWAHSQVPWYAVPFVHISIAPSLENVSNVDALEHYQGPLLLLAGGKDTITPPRFAKELYAKSATPKPLKVLYIAKNERHGTVLDDAEARQQYETFVKDIVLGEQ
jgi:esterase/lipase